MDYDNLVASFKACIDGLKRARIIVDDKVEIIGRPICRWQPAPAKEGRIIIEVEEMPKNGDWETDDDGHVKFVIGDV